MGLIRVGALLKKSYFPFINAEMLSTAPKTSPKEGEGSAVLLRPILKEEDWTEEVKWVGVGITQDETIVIDPGPFNRNTEKDGYLELLIYEEPEVGGRSQPTIEGPRLASALFDGFRWRRLSLLLVPAGWGQDVAKQFSAGRGESFLLPYEENREN